MLAGRAFKKPILKGRRGHGQGLAAAGNGHAAVRDQKHTCRLKTCLQDVGREQVHGNHPAHSSDTCGAACKQGSMEESTTTWRTPCSALCSTSNAALSACCRFNRIFPLLSGWVSGVHHCAPFGKACAHDLETSGFSQVTHKFRGSPGLQSSLIHPRACFYRGTVGPFACSIVKQRAHLAFQVRGPSSGNLST